jgi:hypothetical protein
MVNRVFYEPHSLFDSSHGFERNCNLFYFQDPCNIIHDPMDVGKEILHVGGLFIVRSSPSFFLFHCLPNVFVSIAYAFKTLVRWSISSLICSLSDIIVPLMDRVLRTLIF